MAGDLRITGADQLAAVSRDLKLAGTAGKGLRTKLRTNLRLAATPIAADVKRGIFAIGAKGVKSTGLRTAMMRAVRISTSLALKGPTVNVIVDAKKMPPGQDSLPQLFDTGYRGSGSFDHPVYGDRENWQPQQSAGYSQPAVDKNLESVQAAAIAAVNETALQIETGNLL